MEFQRSSGVLLHISSLPSAGGIGDMGPEAHRFLGFLAEAKQHVWQVLPLGPTGYGNSPYSSSSAFAGNPFLISLEFLADWGWVERERIWDLPGGAGNVDFGAVETRKMALLEEAARSFLARGPHEPLLAGQWAEFHEFCRANETWLTDYALYAEIRRQQNTGAWTAWPEGLRRRDPRALAEFVQHNGLALAREQALQFAFAKQWENLRHAAHRLGIRVLGDVAIFVSMDSADVWTNPSIFELDEQLNPVRVAGVPPDYFSPTGQRWGNPLYRWDVLREQGFEWWIERMRRAHELYDIIRLDHFRGFEAYWAIPAEEPTAIHGVWTKAPGLELFRALETALGRLPLVAEDLGLITKEVDELRLALKQPGMRVVQFGFDSAEAHMHLPQQFTPDTAAYTGTHDNDTTQGWFDSAPGAHRQSRGFRWGEGRRQRRPSPDRR